MSDAEAHPDVLRFPPDPERRGRPPRCLACGYALVGLYAARCPECGKTFDPQRADTFSYKAPFDRVRFWTPVAVTAVFTATAWAAAFYAIGSLGWGLFLGVPMMMGLLLWYRHPRALFSTLGVATISAIGVVALLATLGLAGLFCAIVLLPFYIGFAYAGVLLGIGICAILKAILHHRGFSQRDHLALIAILLLPGAAHLLERKLVVGVPDEVVSTAIVFDAPPGRAWDAWMFYEEVEHDPPWTLRVGFPKPVAVVHRIEQAGDIEVCVYDKGRLVKRATHVEPGVALRFEVIEQRGVEDRSIALIDGGFAFTPVGDGQTRVCLTTRYEPKLTPRVIWRPLEHRFAHDLHRHVLAGMEDRLAGQLAAGDREGSGDR